MPDRDVQVHPKDRRDGADGRFWRGWGLALAGSGLLVLLATLPPFVGEGARAALMQAFSAACHQMPERSPHLHGVVLAVCHRCYGIYWGLPLAALLFLWLRRWDRRLGPAAPWLVPLSLVPPGLDWLGDVVGLWVNTPWSRLLTGGVFGLVAGYYLARALVELFTKRTAQAARSEQPASGVS